MHRFTLRATAVLIAHMALAVPAFAYSEAALLQDDRLSADIYRTGDVQGALVQAKAVYERAASAFGPKAANTLSAGITLCTMLRGVGDDGAALTFAEGLHDTAVASFSPSAPIRIKVAVNYANLLADMGQADRALPLHIEAVAAAEALLGPDDEATQIFSFNLAKTYEILGYGEQALGVYRTIAGRFDRVASTKNLAQRANVNAQIARTSYEMGKDAEAVDGYRKALPLLADYWGPNHPYVLQQKLVFGYALWRTGQQDEVTALVRDLGAQATLTFGPQSVFHADVWELQALTLSNGGPDNPQFADALSLMERSIEVKAALLEPTHKALGRPMLNYAAMLRDTGDFASAAKFALRAEAASMASRDLLIATLVGAANAGQMPDQDVARELFRIVQQSSASQAGFASLQLAARLSLTRGDDAGQFRQVTDAAQRQTQLEKQLLDQISQPLAKRDMVQEAALRSDIADNASSRARAQAALDVNHPNIADLIGGGILTVPEVQTLLGPEGALVVVDFGQDDAAPGLAMAVTEAGVSFAILPYSISSYVEAVADVRAGISLELGTRGAAPLDDQAPAAKQGFNFYAADWLYDTTIGQVFAINGKRKHLYVDLRGPLASVPPHLLITAPVDENVTAQTAPWLVRDFAITVVPSIFSLKLASLGQGGAKPRLSMLGFANPIYTHTGADLGSAAGQSMRSMLTPLPETEAELVQVAASVNAEGDTLRLGPEASEAEVKTAPLGDYGILYFATHGLVSGDAVGNAVLGEPALALTGGSGEDGLLTATEIARLRLNAGLVVLSACNTAVGDRPGAQALSGLARSFTYAGARSLLVSHWPVESRSAVAMMTDIFARRAADPTLSAAQAQREAILSMIAAPQNPAWSHPAYWAPFVLVGDPG